MNKIIQRIINPRKTVRGAWNRLKIASWKMFLKARCVLAGGTIWTRQDSFLLPFHAQGGDDQQEIYYQMHGAKWLAAERKRVEKWLPQRGTVIDVGANLGFTTLVFSQIIGDKGKIFAFEPSPLVFSRLVEVIEKNGLKEQVECLNLGCGTGAAEETLVIPMSSGNATIKRRGIKLNGSVKEVAIKIDSLDSTLFSRLNHLDFIKIDTEGFEDQVLVGAEKLVERFRPVFYIELSQEYETSSQKAILWLKSHGYLFDSEPDLSSAHNGDNFIAYPSERVCQGK